MLFCPNCKTLVTPVINLSGNGQKKCSVCSSPLSEHREIAAGTNLCGFIIERELGRGGMGVVYLARQMNLNRHVAVKVLSDELASDSKFVDAFFHEARAAANLAHPNIVQAYDAGVTRDQVYYFVMELAEGENLDSKIAREGRLDMDLAMNVALHVAEALDYAWKHCMLCHGDIKPENIILTEAGEIKLADLGLAKDFREENPYTNTELMATPAYAPPEVIRGDLSKIGVKSDMYSFGATLYHIFTGVPPFSGDDPEKVCDKQLNEQCAPLVAVDPVRFPERLSVLVDHLMEKDPAKRPASWSDVAYELSAINASLRPHPVVIVPAGSQSAVSQEKSDGGKSFLGAAAVFLCVLAISLAGVVGFLLWKKNSCVEVPDPSVSEPETVVEMPAVPHIQPPSIPVFIPEPATKNEPVEVLPEVQTEPETKNDDDIEFSLSIEPESVPAAAAPVDMTQEPADTKTVSESVDVEVPSVDPVAVEPSKETASSSASPAEPVKPIEPVESVESASAAKAPPAPVKSDAPASAGDKNLISSGEAAEKLNVVISSVKSDPLRAGELPLLFDAWKTECLALADAATKKKAEALSGLMWQVAYPVYSLLSENSAALEGRILFPFKDKFATCRFFDANEFEIQFYVIQGRTKTVRKTPWRDLEESDMKRLVCDQLIFSPVFAKLTSETQKVVFVKAVFLYGMEIPRLKKRYSSLSHLSAEETDSLADSLKMLGFQ